jgi:CheY-like chemotaxis protein
MQNEVVRFERELQRTQKLLAQQGVLANEIAHELKNPITAILCSVDTLDLVAGKNLEFHQRRTLHAIKEFGENILKLLSDFLDVSRAESGLLSSRPETLELDKSVTSVQALLQAASVKNQVDVEFEAPQALISVWMDPRHFKQVLFNIIHNAIKFSSPGGKVVISAKRTPHDTVVVAVADQGSGMSEEIVAHAFDPYFSHQSSTSNHAPGIGLGLPLCKSLVALAGGEISLDTRPGKGTTVFIEIPASTVPHEVPVDAVASNSIPVLRELDRYPLHGQRVLVMEEDPRTRSAVTELIEAWGGLAEGVSDATDAVEALGNQQFDAIMIDNAGAKHEEEVLVQVVSELKALGKTVILSSEGEPTHESSVYGVPVVHKPYNGDKLLYALLEGLRPQRATH